MIKFINFLKHKNQDLRDDRHIFANMLIGAILSLVASLVLSIEAVHLAQDPNAVLSCSINSVINCATVSLHPSASMLGFPNSFLGLIAEPVVITVAIIGFAGVVMPRGFMFAAQIGYTIGFIFAYVLLYFSFFIIRALCPWCLLVTLTTTLVFFSMTRYNIKYNNLYLPKKLQKQLKRLVDRNYDRLLMWTLIVIIISGIIVKYGADLFN